VVTVGAALTTLVVVVGFTTVVLFVVVVVTLVGAGVAFTTGLPFAGIVRTFFVTDVVVVVTGLETKCKKN